MNVVNPKYLLYKYEDLVYHEQILFLCPHGHNVTTAKSVIKSAHGLYPITSRPSSYQLELGLGTF